MIDDWTPQQEDIDWTKEHANSMAVGDTWSVSGALIEKTGDTELTLRQYPAESAMAVERVAKVCAAIPIDFNAKEAELIQDPMEAAQNAAQQWVEPESGIPLVNFDLDNAEWSMTAVPSQDESGNSIIVDQWVVRITHPNEDGDEHEVLMTPMDYHLVAGDDVFFTWRGMRVVEREEAIQLANSREFLLQMLDGGVNLLGDTFVDEDESESHVPPHMRGMLVTKLPTLGEEE